MIVFAIPLRSGVGSLC